MSNEMVDKAVVQSDQVSACMECGKIEFHLFNTKIVDKKEILRTVSIACIYCSSDKVGTVYLV
jgi:DNA-directed RNA polymerase subunit RPC12/RpoP